MKVKYLTDKGIDIINNNIDLFQKTMLENPDDNSWVESFMGESIMVTSNIDLDFNFELENTDIHELDCENAIKLYETLKEKGIGNAIIYDEKFMAGFILQFGYKYFMKRWGAEQKTYITDALLFKNGKRRSMARNSVGRLYQRVRLSIDESNAVDKYELTRFAFNHPGVFRIEFFPIFDSNKVSVPFIKAMKKWVDAGNEITRMDDVIRHYTVLCNVNVAEEMDENDIIDYLIEYLQSRDNKVEL